MTAVAHAKDFLRTRILAAASANNVALSISEIAMLTYSAAEERHPKQEDTQIDEEIFERKIATLIRSAYEHDVAHGMKDEWKRHLRALRGEDLYVLTMAESAGVFKGGSFRAVASPSVDTVCLAALGAAGWSFFFTTLGSDAIPSGNVRIALFLVWVAALWTLGEWSRRRIGRR